MDLASLALFELTSGANRGMGTSLGSTDDGSATNSNRSTLRRCRTREQGVALLTISHAIEYLLHSRSVQLEDATNAEREALAILLNANLSVYREGTEVIPFSSRLRQWFHGGATNNRSASVPV